MQICLAEGYCVNYMRKCYNPLTNSIQNFLKVFVYFMKIYFVSPQKAHRLDIETVEKIQAKSFFTETVWRLISQFGSIGNMLGLLTLVKKVRNLIFSKVPKLFTYGMG